LQNKKLLNKKTYQELIFQASELRYKKQEIIFELNDSDKNYQKQFKKENKLSEKDKVIGISFGSGKRWLSKSWSKKKVKEIIKNLVKTNKIILLGGPEEIKQINKIKEEIKQQGEEILSNNPDNTIGEFAAVLDLCDKIITTDSLTLHLAIALKKPTVALFFCTPPWEIEGYGNIFKIQYTLLKENFFSTQYSEKLANSISTEQVLKAINSLEKDE
jgi:ADP-heptose:LPS heptosyltransferase